MAGIFGGQVEGSERAFWRSYLAGALVIAAISAALLLASVLKGFTVGRVDMTVPSAVALLIALIWILRSALRWRRASNEPMDLSEFDEPLSGDRLSRYSFAVFMVIGAWFFHEEYGQRSRPNELFSFWAPLVMAIMAALFAWDIALLLLALAAVALLLYLIAQMPTSIAIVLGACIIAYAVYRSRMRR